MQFSQIFILRLFTNSALDRLKTFFPIVGMQFKCRQNTVEMYSKSAEILFAIQAR